MATDISFPLTRLRKTRRDLRGAQCVIKNLCTKIALTLIVLFCASSQAIEVGDTLIVDNLTTLDGQTITRESLAGKHIVVQVWASWCPYCHRQNINLIELVKRTEGKPLQVIGLSVDRNPQDAVDYVAKHALNFPMAMMTPEMSRAIGKRRGIPELYVVNPQGKVAQKDYGEMVDLDIFDLADFVK